MFNSISWQTYLQFIAIGSGIYYCTVILLFFRPEARAIIGKAMSSKRNGTAKNRLENVSHTEILQRKLDEIKETLIAHRGQASKEDLLAAIRITLSNYDQLHLSLHRDAIALFISTQTYQICGFDLSEQEISESIPAQ